MKINYYLYHISELPKRRDVIVKIKDYVKKAIASKFWDDPMQFHLDKSLRGYNMLYHLLATAVREGAGDKAADKIDADSLEFCTKLASEMMSEGWQAHVVESEYDA